MNNARRIKVNAFRENWPITGDFAISRGSKTQAEVVVVELEDGEWRGRGECVPYARYGETVDGTLAAIRHLGEAIAAGMDRHGLQSALPAGAARNALDCAFWDLEAKRGGMPAHTLAGLPPPAPLTTAYTISLGAPRAMAEAARAARGRPLLKVKLGSEDDAARLAAVREAAPHAELIVDANEGWREDNVARNLAVCAAAGVTLVEQPLPTGSDAILADLPRPLAICADESVHGTASLAALAGRYDMVNIKLDKAGGLTEALALAQAARGMGLGIMIGSMVATSLAMAPAMLVAQGAHVVDLDGPLLLARDRPHGLRYDGSTIYPPDPALWG